MKTPLPIPVQRSLKKLGTDISLARRRRQMSQASLAERIGASTMTVRRMEKGNPLIPLQYVARALHVFGELGRLDQLLDTPEDVIGLSLMDERLPERVRARKPGRSEKQVGAL